MRELKSNSIRREHDSMWQGNFTHHPAIVFSGGNFFEGVLPAIVNSGFILLLSPNALVEDVSVTSPALGPIVQSQRIRRSHELGFCITWKCSCQEQVHH